jgi:hypothetical protein
MATYKVYGYDATNIVPVIPSSSDDLSIPGNAVVTGNLTVNGTTTTVDSEIATADNFVHLNAKYMTDAVKNGGFVFTVDPENNELNGNINISSATTIVIGSEVVSNFQANDIIQITDSEDPANDGLYQIHTSLFSSPNTTITIKDASSNVPSASVSGFVKNSLTTNSDDDTMKIRVVKVGVLDTDSANGKFRVAFGSTALMTYANVLTDADTIFVAADNISAGDAAVNLTTTSGNITIDAQANDSDIIFKGTDGGSDTTFLTLDGSAAGEAIFNAGIVIADGGNIGSASDKDAISIASGGDVTLSQDLRFADGKEIGSATTADLLTINADDLTIKATKSLKVDTISESTATGGVTIDGVKLVDNAIVIPNDSTIGSVGSASAIAIASDGKLTLAGNIQLPDGGNIGVSGDGDAISIANSGKVTISSDLDLGSDLALTANKGIGYDFTSAGTTAIGNVLYLNASGKVALADADALSSSHVVAVSRESGGADDDVFCNTVYGVIIDVLFESAPADGTDASSGQLKKGMSVYLSGTSGKVSTTAPSGSQDVVLRLGFAMENGNGSDVLRQIIFQPEFIIQHG